MTLLLLLFLIGIIIIIIILLLFNFAFRFILFFWIFHRQTVTPNLQKEGLTNTLIVLMSYWH